jgi:hypothetical protein
MRIQDIIRNMIDMIDGVEKEPEQTTTVIVAHPTATIDEPEDASPLSHAGDDMRRLRQIVDLADNDGVEPYGNTPKEKYADIDAVTVDAGGGMNGPKDPSDIRGDHVSLYPGFQAGSK